MNILEKWHAYSQIRANIHSQTASYYELCHYILGPCTIIIGGVSSLGQFINISDDPDSNWAITIAVFTVLSTIGSSLQTFFRWDKLSTKHQQLSIKYEHLNRNMEEYIFQFHQRPSEEQARILKKCKQDLNALSSEPLNIPYFIHRKISKNTFQHDYTPSLRNIIPTPITDEPPHIQAIQDEQHDVHDLLCDKIISRLNANEKYQIQRLNENSAE